MLKIDCLEGPTVKLIPLTTEFINKLYEAGENPNIWTYMPLQVETYEDMVKFVDIAIQGRSTGTQFPFVIVDKVTNEVLGSTRYMDISEEHRRLEIGTTWLTSRAWRTHINTECKFLLLEYAFEQLGMNRVQIKTDHENIKSQKAIVRIGAKPEGIWRNHMIRPNGTIRHTVVYSVIKEEWLETKAYIESLMNRH